MSGTRKTTDSLDPRRRKALYHAWHRGTREMDLLLGGFADAFIGHLSERDLTAFEDLMNVPDQDLFDWICGRSGVASNYDTPLFRQIVAFHENRVSR